MQLLFAHAGEAHDTVTQAASHSVLSRWYIALPLFFGFISLLTFTTYVLSRKSKAITYNVLLAALFIIGVATYTTSAPVSVLSLSVGFAMALFQVLIGLSKPNHEEVKE